MAVETIIDEHIVRELIPALKAAGAEGDYRVSPQQSGLLRTVRRWLFEAGAKPGRSGPREFSRQLAIQSEGLTLGQAVGLRHLAGFPPRSPGTSGRYPTGCWRVVGVVLGCNWGAASVLIHRIYIGLT